MTLLSNEYARLKGGITLKSNESALYVWSANMTVDDGLIILIILLEMNIIRVIMRTI